jgi:hypothetical protein
MIVLDVLCAWWALAAIAVVDDAVRMFRSLTGRKGEEAPARVQAMAARSGGVRRWVVIIFLLDIVMPWLWWRGMIAAYLNDDID